MTKERAGYFIQSVDATLTTDQLTEITRRLADAERLAELGQRLLDEAADYGRGWTVEEFLENEPLVKQFREALAAWAFVER